MARKTLGLDVLDTIRDWAKGLFAQKVELDNYYNKSDADKKYATKEDISNVSLGYEAEDKANKAKAGGYASLDDMGKIPEVQLPSNALKDTTYSNANANSDGLMSKQMYSKLSGTEDNAQENKIETIKRNGSILQITSKAVDINVPTKVSELTNDKNFATKEDVNTAVTELNSIRYIYADSLPTSGQEQNAIYVVPSTKTGDSNVKEEFLWTGTQWEKFGEFTSEVDTSLLWSKEELTYAANDEVLAVLNEVV